MLQKIATSITDQARSTEHPEMYSEFICTLSQMVLVMPEIMSIKLPEVLECLERHFIRQYAPYVDVLCKVCLLLQRLITEIADSMIVHMKVWTPWIFFPLCHENNEVRDIAKKNLELCFPIFSMMEKTVLPLIVGSVRSHLIKEMKLMYPNQAEYTLKLWGNIIKILGVTLHRSSPFINSLLEIVECAMKTKDEAIFIEALNAWKYLISNFAANLDVIGSGRRLKLLLQPLKCNILATERVSVAKCETWWHIVWSLDEKLNSNFELVCLPLLQYTFSSPLKMFDAKNTSPATTRSGAKASSEKSVMFDHKSNCLQKLACEILCRLLEQLKWGSPGGLHSPKKIPNFSLVPLKSFISNQVYLQNVSIFTQAAKIAISANGHNDNYTLLIQYILQLLTSRTARLANSKEECSVEAISRYFQLVSDIVINKQCKITYIVKLLDDLKMFPREQMLSQIPGIGHKGRGNTPLLVVSSIMIESDILKSSFCNDWYFSTLKHYLSMSQSMLVPLSFTNSVMEMLKQVSPQFSNDVRILCKVWSSICLNLLETVEKTQEVNESNESCDFTSIAMVLLYPLQHLTSSMHQVCDKQLWKNWCDLYKAFARCSALVATAEANVACQVVAKMMHENVSREDMQVFSISLLLCQLMQTIVDSIDYAALGREFSQGSPSAWYRRNEKPLHNISSLVMVLGNLLSVFSKMIEEYQSAERKKDSKQLLECTGNLMAVVQKLIANVTTSSLLRVLTMKLLPYLLPFFSCSAKKHYLGRTYSAQFQQNMEAIWSTILTSLQIHYSGPYDTEFLESICPLLEVNLLSSHRSSVERTCQFWHSTFGCNLHNLTLPASFKNTLRKVRPPLIPCVDVSLIEDTSSSFLSSQEFTNNTAIKKGSSILRKTAEITGCQVKQTFLLPKDKAPSNKTVLRLNCTDHVGNSKPGKPFPVKNCEEKPCITPSKKLLDDNEEAFIVILPQNKKQILTEHQKEMKRKRSFVPAMYNDLSQETANVDSQSFSQSFFTPEEVETVVPSLVEDGTFEDKILNKGKETTQEPEVVIIESSDVIISTSAKPSLDSSTYDENSEMTFLTKEKSRNAKQADVKSPSQSPIVLSSSSNDENINMRNVKNNRKSHPQEGNLKQTNVIQEATKNIVGNSNKGSNSERLLVTDPAKDLRSMTPLKQGILRLMKNKNRLSKLFPKLGHATAEVHSDLDDDDAIPSSQESPNVTNNIGKLNRTCKLVPLKKNISFLRNGRHDLNFNTTISVNENDANNLKTMASTKHTRSPNSIGETEVSQCSEVLLSELGRNSSVSSKGSSEESVRIIKESCAKVSITDPEIKPVCFTTDLTGDSSPKVNVSSLKHSISPSQYISGSNSSQSLHFNPSSCNEYQPSLNLISSSNENATSNNDTSADKSPESMEDLRTEQQCLERSTPSRPIQDALQTENSNSVNYKELLESCLKTYGSQQPGSNSIEDALASNSAKSDHHNFSCHIQPSTTPREISNLPTDSSVSPAVNRVLFPEENHSPSRTFNDLLTKPITAGYRSEEIGTNDNIEKVGIMEHNKSPDISLCNLNEPNNSVTSFCDSCQIVKENRNTHILAVENSSLEEQSDGEFALLNDKKASQLEQEQTPELKSPILPLSAHNRQRQKVAKAGKLKSIELEKLFSDSGKDTAYEYCSATTANSFDNSISTNLEKPKGARKRKSKTPISFSNRTSPVATRLRVRNSAAKQRVIQKSCLRGRPKSRSTSLGIAHRHKPRRLSSVSIKSPTKILTKDEEILDNNKDEKDDENLNATETKNCFENMDNCEKQDKAKKINDVKESSREKIPLLETKTIGSDTISKDEIMMKMLLPDLSKKRPLADIKNYKTKQHSFSLPISPLSRSQKILRAAIGNFSEKSASWKPNKFGGSPKHVNILPDNSSPESVKFSTSLAKQASPFASPSTGILKKRKITEGDSSSSPSPLQKQRKVSFADPIVQSSILVESSNEDERPSKPVNRCLEMPKSPAVAAPRENYEIDIKDILPSSESSVQTSEEYQITPSSYYDTKEKVFPYLTDCNEPVEAVLPYLTCSLFPTGLGQLLRARNIFTVGDLCSLTIPELLRLPIRSPKLETVRKAMHMFMEMDQKTKISPKEKSKEGTETSECETQPESVEDVEHTLGEKTRCIDETLYADASEDLPLTPMPDSDSEDSFFSFVGKSQRCEVESFVEGKSENICDGTVSENRASDFSPSNKTTPSNSGYLSHNKSDLMIQDVSPFRTELAVSISSKGMCGKEQNKMKTITSKSQNPNGKEKLNDGTFNNKSSSFTSTSPMEKCNPPQEEPNIDVTSCELSGTESIKDSNIHNKGAINAGNKLVCNIAASETETSISDNVRQSLDKRDETKVEGNLHISATGLVAEIEGSLNISIASSDSRTEVKCSNGDSLSGCPDHGAKNLDNTANCELQESISVSAMENEDRPCKLPANDPSETAISDLSEDNCVMKLTPVQNGSFQQHQNFNETNQFKDSDISNLKGVTMQNGINEECLEYEGTNKESINNIASVETAIKQNDLNYQDSGNENIEHNPEFETEELCSNKNECSLDRHKECVVEGNGSQRLCVIAQETEAVQFHRYADDAPNRVAIEANVPQCCDTQDIIETVNKLISEAAKGNVCEVVLNNNNNIFSTIESAEQSKTSPEFQLTAEKHEVVVSKTLSDQATTDKPAYELHCSKWSSCNKKTMASTEDECEMSSARMDESGTEQSEPEHLQTLFTIENLKKVSLLQLVDMLDKLSAVIRTKSEEISNLSNSSRH